MPENEVNATGTPVRKKKKGCCFGCLVIILVFVAVAIGIVGYYWYQGMPKKSAVEKEYNTIPEYFEN